jgi:HSP20 family protein
MAKGNSLVKRETRSDVTTPEQVPAKTTYTPRVDILETPDELVLFADLPGVRAGDVDVRFENGDLVLHGRCEPRGDSRGFFLQEYGTGDFYRAFTLNETIDSDKITAEHKNGVLTVHLPRSEKVKPKRITVKGE